MSNSIQIFACDHRSDVQWDLPFIQLGTGTRCSSNIKDSIGENISQYDILLSEGTSIWWLYKNIQSFGNPSYIGFCHYRRFFTLLKPNFFSYPIHRLDELPQSCKDYILNPEQCLSLIQENHADGILPAKFIDYGYVKRCKNIQDLMHEESKSYGLNLGLPKDFCYRMFNFLIECCPVDMQSQMENTFSILNTYHFNMFILHNSLFKLYNQIIWNAIFKCIAFANEKLITGLNPRWAGYVLERFSSCIFLMFQMQDKKFIEVPILELNKEKYN